LISVEGCIDSLTGDPTSGARLIERGVEMYNRIRVYTFMPFYTAIAARGHAAGGELDEAQRLLDLSTTTLERTGELWQKPFVMCAAARVAHAAATVERDPGRLSAAAEIVREAHAVAIAQGAHGTAAHVARAAQEIGVQIESTGMFRL
jgi:hypothetical protein